MAKNRNVNNATQWDDGDDIESSGYSYSNANEEARIKKERKNSSRRRREKKYLGQLK